MDDENASNGLDLQNNDVSTSRSNVQNGQAQQNAGASSGLAGPSAGSEHKNEQETTMGAGSAQTPMNAIVPFQGPDDDQRQGTERTAISTEMPADMQPMMEEMESVLYSISFGK